MQTINNFLQRNFKSQLESRLEKLEELSAPQVIIDKIKEQLTTDCGLSEVGKIKEFGHLEFVDFTTQKYRRGTGINFELENGKIAKMIPGPYSRFLTY